MASRHRSARMISVAGSTLVLALGVGAYFQKFLPSQSGREFPDPETVKVEADLPSEIEAALGEVDAEGLSKAEAVLQTTRGRIRIRFYTREAPVTVKRIATLIHSGFYNGLIFHRVEPGFVIQGGDPTGTGTEGSGKTLPAEFNSRPHVSGTVAMARANDPNSADSQFYISLGTHPHLDGKYTVFGQVVEGQAVADQIQVGDRMTSFSFSAQFSAQ
jgi:cyclophilin family peptidyl-prolyl cis-trans isomerase